MQPLNNEDKALFKEFYGVTTEEWDAMDEKDRQFLLGQKVMQTTLDKKKGPPSPMVAEMRARVISSMEKYHPEIYQDVITHIADDRKILLLSLQQLGRYIDRLTVAVENDDFFSFVETNESFQLLGPSVGMMLDKLEKIFDRKLMNVVTALIADNAQNS